MTTKYIQPGKVIQYTAGGTIAAGAVVVMGNTLGVALVNMVSGQTGSVAIEGVFTLPKASAAVIAQGESLTWDVSAGNFDDNAATPASGDITGAAALAFAAAAATTTTVQVKLTGAPGTKTA